MEALFKQPLWNSRLLDRPLHELAGLEKPLGTASHEKADRPDGIGRHRARKVTPQRRDLLISPRGLVQRRIELRKGLHRLEHSLSRQQKAAPHRKAA